MVSFNQKMSLTNMSKELISEKFQSIEYGVDATCGNGHDTLFLAGLCSPDGMIFSFDVQEEALNKAEKLLNENNLPTSVMFVNTGHENMEKVIKPNVDVVMFNLGFLPNSESKICTRPGTTITALNSACRKLNDHGIITIICYPGTLEGRAETKEVKDWIAGLDNNTFNISEHLSEKPNETTPVLYVVEKIRGSTTA